MARSTWYFVCSRCEAKWFGRRGQLACPRCGLVSVSKVQLGPPWQFLRLNGTPGKETEEIAMAHRDAGSQATGSSTILITADQLAAWLQISKRSLYRLRSDGTLPAPLRLRHAVRWRVADIEAWLTAGCPASTVTSTDNGRQQST